MIRLASNRVSVSLRSTRSPVIRQGNGFSIKLTQAPHWTFESFIGKTEVKLIMANGDSIFVSGDSNRTYVNGYQFLNSESAASNGTMLALQNVLVAPSQNLEQVMNSDTSLTFFSQAILLATPVPDTLANLLSTGGPFTLLAPNNDAFRILGYNSPADLNLVNPDSLRTMVFNKHDTPANIQL